MPSPSSKQAPRAQDSKPPEAAQPNRTQKVVGTKDVNPEKSLSSTHHFIIHYGQLPSPVSSHSSPSRAVHPVSLPRSEDSKHDPSEDSVLQHMVLSGAFRPASSRMTCLDTGAPKSLRVVPGLGAACQRSKRVACRITLYLFRETNACAFIIQNTGNYSNEISTQILNDGSKLSCLFCLF